jgi:nitroreductase
MDMATADPIADLIARRYGKAGFAPEGGDAVLAALLSHRSVRGYAPEPVPEGDIALALAAAQSAATSSNLQTWSVVTVTDPARKSRLNALAGDQKQIDQAPLLMVWLADLSRLRLVAGPEAAALDYLELFLTAAIDATLAAQNAVAAFEAMGYGTCYIGAMRNHPPEVAQELALPKEAFAVFGLTVGRPAPGAEGEVKPRLPQGVIRHAEQYGESLPEGAAAAYDAEMLAFQAAQGMGDAAWTARCTDRVATTQAMRNRDNLRRYLNEMGFALK